MITYIIISTHFFSDAVSSPTPIAGSISAVKQLNSNTEMTPKPMIAIVRLIKVRYPCCDIAHMYLMFRHMENIASNIRIAGFTCRS